MSEPVVVVHGGAWAIPDSLAEASVLGVESAARAAWAILSSGGSSLDAVEAAVRVLEDDPAFDAGTGSVLTLEGEVELDAMIMEGKELRAGGVACVRNIKNPVSLARLIMERTDHTLLVGKGANDFAQAEGVEVVPPEQLVTPEAVQQWELYRKYKSAVSNLFHSEHHVQQCHHDTVGCVALDSLGNLAVATSTGGITAKRPGRVGDSPIIGAGGYADNASAAVSTTGHGESISKVVLAKRIADGCGGGGLSPNESIRSSLKYMGDRLGGCGGGICVDANGACGVGFTTKRMAWAVIKRDGGGVAGLNPGDKIPFHYKNG